MSVVLFEELLDVYAGMTRTVSCECELATEMLGGVPAGEKELATYVKHALRLEGTEALNAIERIRDVELNQVKSVEIVEKAEKEASEGDLEEKQTIGVNLIRRDAHGPWIGDWMIKACLKAAASRVGLFVAKRGVKGDIAELGQVMGIGVSKAPPEIPTGLFSGSRIYLRDSSGEKPAATDFQILRGSVSTPKGRTSIHVKSEFVPVGSRFDFSVMFHKGRITDKDIKEIFAAAMVIGVGSAKAFEKGKFRINKLTIED